MANAKKLAQIEAALSAHTKGDCAACDNAATAFGPLCPTVADLYARARKAAK